MTEQQAPETFPWGDYYWAYWNPASAKDGSGMSGEERSDQQAQRKEPTMFWKVVQFPFALAAWLYNGITKGDWRWT